MELYVWLIIGGAAVLLIILIGSILFQTFWGGWKHKQDTKPKRPTKLERDLLRK